MDRGISTLSNELLFNSFRFGTPLADSIHVRNFYYCYYFQEILGTKASLSLFLGKINYTTSIQCIYNVFQPQTIIAIEMCVV